MPTYNTKFISIKEFADAIGVSPEALRLWDRQGKLKPHHRTPSGERIYLRTQIEEFLDKYSEPDDLWNKNKK